MAASPGAPAAIPIDFLNKWGNEMNFCLSNPREPSNPIIYASEGFFKMSGYKPSEILNKNCRILQGPGTSKQAIMEIRDAIREERSTSICLLNYRKGGEPFWNAFTLAPIKNQDNMVEYFIGIQVDVTNLVGGNKIDEQAVKEVAADEMAKAALLAKDVQEHPALLQKRCSKTCATCDVLPSSFLTGMAGIAGSFVLSANEGDLPMVFCSPGFLRLTGYSCDELIGKNCRFLQGPGTDRATVREIKEAILAERPISTTLLNYKKDGTPFQNCILIAPVRDSQGKVVFFVGVQMDAGTGDVGDKPGRASAVNEGMIAELNGGEEERNGAKIEPTGMQLLKQKGIVAQVKVAARSLGGAHGLRRLQSDQERPSVSREGSGSGSGY